MNKSSTLGEFAKAMNQFKKEHPVIELDEKVEVRNRDGKYLYAYMFASMQEIQSKVDPYLEANGLSIIQGIEDGGKLSTLVLHTSGEFIETVMDLDVMREVDKDGRFTTSGPQEFGALVTYARRYTKLAALNLSPMKKFDNRVTFKPNTEESPEIPSGPVDANAQSTPPGSKGQSNSGDKPWLNLRTRGGNYYTEDGEKAIAYMKNGGTIEELKKSWRLNRDTQQELLNFQLNEEQLANLPLNEKIKKEIADAKSIEELTQVHADNPALHKNKEFLEALSSRKQAVRNQKPQTVAA